MAAAPLTASTDKNQIADKFPPLCASEREILISLIKVHEKVNENKKTSRVFNHAKENAWKKLTSEFNSHPDVCKRSEKNLRKSWENMKARTKREFAADKKSTFQTGGGKKDIAAVSEESLKVHGIVGPQIDPLENMFDDDAEVLTVDSDDKENSSSFSIAALQTAHTSNDVSESSDEEFSSSKSIPRGRKRKQSNEDRLMDMEAREHKLRCKGSIQAMKQSQELHDKRLKLLELEEKYWMKKVTEVSVGADAIIL